MGDSEGVRQRGSCGRIVITGASGFIGSHLVSGLVGADFEIVCILEPGAENPFVGAQTFFADICTARGLSEALTGAKVVVHLAARNHVLRETAKDPLLEYRRVNVEGTRKVVQAARKQGVGLFVHVSSIKAMGEGTGGILDETAPRQPSTPYGISKLESEEAVRSGVDGTEMAVVIFRLPMVYGPGNKGNLPRLIRWADRGLPFPLVQPDSLRSMVYVGNVVAAVKAVLEAYPTGDAGPKTYIIKDDSDYSTRMIYSSICRELGKVPRFLPLPALLGRVAGAISEDFRKVTSSFRVSSAKIRKEIGFVPPFSGEEGIARTVRWYKRSAR
ncbi:MAG: NAD-dependent epimerase/dehydratase family protein [Deltaproteobacteria bacterium]|nr:MAG: NAD-dependent epimerase/dehydratase family protein [Deltaproteobacteria bacterium]